MSIYNQNPDDYPLEDALLCQGLNTYVHATPSPYLIERRLGFNEEEVGHAIDAESLSPRTAAMVELIAVPLNPEPSSELSDEPSSSEASELERCLTNAPLHPDQPVNTELEPTAVEMAAQPNLREPAPSPELLLLYPYPNDPVAPVKAEPEPESESELTETAARPPSPVISESEPSLYEIPAYPGIPISQQPRPPVLRIRDIPARRGQLVPLRRASALQNSRPGYSSWAEPDVSPTGTAAATSKPRLDGFRTPATGARAP
ncbi:hypothetical protein FBEOM_12123 [Fusarium beomiforme]|uniref:Uncharacterized protein n=1 Tax=Fusarium beomiforme TaxID=44412 RepID=A0A9P5DQY7_9HYPO|nr:hypothetical protein FBEOM_12123 [Fusarium beomiforme]